MIEGRLWNFLVRAPTQENEVVYIAGSCNELGNWDPHRIIPLLKRTTAESSAANGTNGASAQDTDDDTWTISLQLPLQKVGYRYCIAVSTAGSCSTVSQPSYAIRRWETHFSPRSIDADVVQTSEEVSVFGHSAGQRHVEAGWLVDDTAVHLQLCTSKNHAKPIALWKKKHSDRKVRVKVTPLELGGNGSIALDDATTELGDSRPPLKPVSWPLMEAAILKEGECSFGPQEQFGIPFDEEFFTVFQCRMLDHTTTAYMFDYYLESATPDDIPHYIGCSYLLPSNLVDNFGVASIPITSPRHMPIGQLTVQYLVVKPMSAGISDLSVSYARYWKESWKGLEVGHRGAGNSYHAHPKSCSNIRENTLASFKYAAESGADMVEIDVQLSRDYVPVIYHDFYACIALKRKKEHQQSDLLEMPIKDLTLQQLQALKVYHRKENGSSKFSDEDFEDHQPFPTLERALKNVSHSCGFNVEVKWTMQFKDGTHELQHPFELNHFLDIILKVVLEHGGSRKIVFSCFHPDICSMLRLKQNRYPVLFLTQGVCDRWQQYNDVRCQTIRQAVLYATTADILGVNMHTEDLLRDGSQIQLALQNNLILFCWGDHNNDKSNIAYLKKLGMHAIIYDKIDVYNSKTEKESIFLCEERQSLGQQASALSSITNSNGASTLGCSSGTEDDYASSSDSGGASLSTKGSCSGAGSSLTIASSVTAVVPPSSLGDGLS